MMGLLMAEEEVLNRVDRGSAVVYLGAMREVPVAVLPTYGVIPMSAER
jgi:hypothetical protein